MPKNLEANLEANIEAAYRAIMRKFQSLPHLIRLPEWAVVLGSGLDNVATSFTTFGQLSYQDIDGFPASDHGQKIKGHSGVLRFCQHPKKKRQSASSNHTVLLLQGRHHYYEGYSLGEVTLPIRVLHRLGVKNLILTNAAGAIRAKLKPGGLMLISDHIHLMGDNPLRGRNLDTFGPRFPDMSHPYDIDYQQLAQRVAKRLKFDLPSGVYASMSGPNYETAAEVSMLKSMGADAVGMSTTPEAIVARHQRMRVMAVSMLANAAAGLREKTLDHDEVVATAQKAAERLGKLLFNFLREV